jgi:hypothetical protein
MHWMIAPYLILPITTTGNSNQASHTWFVMTMVLVAFMITIAWESAPEPAIAPADSGQEGCSILGKARRYCRWQATVCVGAEVLQGRTLHAQLLALMTPPTQEPWP